MYHDNIGSDASLLLSKVAIYMIMSSSQLISTLKFYSLTGLAVAVPCHIHLPALVSSTEVPLSIATPDNV